MTQYVRFKDLRDRGITFTRQHLRRLVDAGEFPAPVNLGASTIAWLASELDEYDARLLAQRETKQADRAQQRETEAACRRKPVRGSHARPAT